MKRHMLMIGGSREIHPKAAALGSTLSLLFNMATIKNRRNMSQYERVIGLPESASKEDWIDAALLIQRMAPVDCVGGFNEPTQHLAAAVAEALGLPYHSPAVIEYTCRKDKMREVLRSAKLDNTISTIVHAPEDLRAFGKNYGYPFVLKPADGRGSLSVVIVRTEAEIDAALARFDRWSPSHPKLLEQFLQGEEWSVEAFSEAGKHRIICVTQKFKDPVTCVETGHCLPASLPPETQKTIEEFVVATLIAIGIENGPSHTEVIVTAHGPRVVETHARLAGDYIVDLIKYATGVDLDDLWIRQVTGESVLHEVPNHFEKWASVAFTTPNAVGVLDRVDGAAEAAACPGVVQVEILQDGGTHLMGPNDSFSRGACVVAIDDTAEGAVARARKGVSCLRFMVSCSS